jgi:membrane protein YdbS with pleckstrin-like domain
MSGTSEATSSWVYNGVWGVLTQVFCVPRDAPVLPVQGNEEITTRKPSLGFLQYLKIKFWVGLVFVLILTMVLSIALAGNDSPWLWIAVSVEVVLLVVGSVIAYLTIHLRFDTMWYVFSDRSMRLRRGIWLIRESTITFENIQNVKVTQGPLQRLFGIADVVVETAGGGGAQAEPGAGLGMHAGLIEGVAEAAQIRDSILSRVRGTNTTGLGDESGAEGQGVWSARHLTVLREIRDLAQQASA